MRGRVHKADPPSRRAAIAILISGALVGASLLAAADRFRPRFERWVEEDPRPRATMVIAIAAIATIGPILGVATYLLRLARRVDRSGRYPPPGVRLLHDVEVQTGSEALRRARQIRLFALLLALAAMLLALLLWSLVSSVMRA